MFAFPVLIAAATLGVDYGWQKTPDGEWEYIVQVEPTLLRNLADGESIVSTMPAEMDGVRRVVLRVGTDPVPRERLPEIRRMAGTSGGDGFGHTTGGATSGQREIVEEWATRPRIDQIPFADRERLQGTSRQSVRSHSSFDKPSGNTATRSNVPFQQRTMALPPANESFSPRASSPSGSASTSGSRQNGDTLIGRTPGRRTDADDMETGDEGYSGSYRSHRSPRNEQDAIDHRQNRSRQWQDNTGYDAQPRSASPPKASIGETRGNPTTIDKSLAPPRSSSSNSVTIISLFLFMSLGGNLYLGWLARDFYWRYRDIAWEIRNNQAGASRNPE